MARLVNVAFIVAMLGQLELLFAFSLQPMITLKPRLLQNHQMTFSSASPLFAPFHKVVSRVNSLPLRQSRRNVCACRMKVAADGDVVAVRYRGTLDDGSVFDENPEGPFLEFEVGSGRVIKGFDEAVRGLSVGESREVRCTPDEAYGQYDEGNVATIPRPEMPEPPQGLNLEPGLMLQLDNGQVAVIKEVTDDSVVLDGNHPLAGKTLNFKVTLHEIKDGEAVAQMQIEELLQVLDSALLKVLAPEVTKDADYVSKTKAKLQTASDKRAVIKEVLDSREWQAIAGALVSNPKLQQLLQDPSALEQEQVQVTELMAPPVTEADFSDDA